MFEPYLFTSTVPCCHLNSHLMNTYPHENKQENILPLIEGEMNS